MGLGVVSLLELVAVGGEADDDDDAAAGGAEAAAPSMPSCGVG